MVYSNPLTRETLYMSPRRTTRENTARENAMTEYGGDNVFPSNGSGAAADDGRPVAGRHGRG